MIKGKNGTLHWLDLNVTQSPWSVIRCPYCGYRMKLCSMCDYRNSERNWDSETGKCRQDREEIWKHFQ